MEDGGRKLRQVRERLNLRYRDVEEASLQIAERHGNNAFSIALSRLADIENKGTVPTIYRIYSLCAIYRLNPLEVLEWYGADMAGLPADAAAIPLKCTQAIGFTAETGEVQLPLAMDSGIDLRKTTYLSRLIHQWGRLPLSLLNAMDLKNHRYALVGTEDWTMYPIVQPGALVLIDENRRKIANSGWNNEHDRPIYFFELRERFAIGWCTLSGNQLVLQPHPASLCLPEVYAYSTEIDVIGEVTGVAMILDRGQRRHAPA